MGNRMPGWVPRADRADVMIKAALRVAGRELPVTIIDMSERGCKIRCLHILPIGEVVELAIPAFQPNAASVRWSLPGIAGLRFI
jgi:PilZ domain-containing protein